MGRRKKSKPVKPKRDIVSELDGWSSGDNCYTVFTGESKPSFCEIIEFHPNDVVTPSVSVTEVVTGKYRCAPMMSIAETAKEAKKLAPEVQAWLKEYKTKKLKLDRERRREQAEQNAVTE